MLERIKGLIREPALLIDLAETLVLMVVAFGVGLNGDQQSYIVAAVIALLGLLKGFLTKPFPASAVTDFGRAALVLFASFGVGLTADQITLIVTALGLITTVVLRGQITPKIDPVVVPGGAGAGPVAFGGPYQGRHVRVKGDEGYAVLGALGLGLVILTVILLVLTLLKVVAVSYIVLVILFVVGLVLLFLDRGTGNRIL